MHSDSTLKINGVFYLSFVLTVFKLSLRYLHVIKLSHQIVIVTFRIMMSLLLCSENSPHLFISVYDYQQRSTLKENSLIDLLRD